MRASHLLAALLALAPALAQADTLRCGSRLISTGDTAYEVQDKCGEPVNRALLGYRERPDDWGFHHEVVVEEWIYGPRNGMYYFLRFEGNRLVTIDSRRSQ